MNIFIISPDKELADTLIMGLNREGYNVTFASNINESIICFKSIINSSGFIDLILLDDDLSDEFSSGQYETGFGFINRFNEEFENIGYHNGIRVIKTPILVMLGIESGFEEIKSGYTKHGCFLIGKPINQENLFEDIPQIIKEWRKKVISDLEYIGYSITFDGFFHVRPIFKKHRKKESEFFMRISDISLPTSFYLVFEKSCFELRRSVEEFEYLLNNYNKEAKKKQMKVEQLFQDFFKRNQEFLLQDQYKKLWSEPVLPYPSKRRFIKPDFVLQPRVAPFIGYNWMIIDLKRPDVDIMEKANAFHRDFTKKLHKGIMQLLDYREYFSRPDTGKTLEKKFGYKPHHPKLALIIGRLEEKETGDSDFDKLIRKTNFANISIISYDEILEFQKSKLTTALKIQN